MVSVDITLYVGAGLDHQLERILKSPANIRKVKKFHPLISETIPEELSNGPGKKEYILRSFDLALVELEKSWTFDERTKISPACLMDFQANRLDGEFLAAGYGNTEPSNSTYPNLEKYFKNFTLPGLKNFTLADPENSTLPDSRPTAEPLPEPWELNSTLPLTPSSSVHKLFMTKFRLLNSTKHLIIVNSTHSAICNGMICMRMPS